MSFYWYLDISESADLTEQPDPDFVSNEHDGVSTVHGEFSVGPISFSENESISVYALVTRIQEAMDDAYESGRTQTRYYIDARQRPIEIQDLAAGAGSATTIAASGVSDIGAARQAGELAIQYRIYNEENISFSLLFRSGVHGYAGNQGTLPGGGNPPVAEVTVINNRDVRGFLSPYAQLSTVIQDRPPMPPDLVFVPYVGVNNKILLLLNSTAGEIKDKPIILQQADVSFVLDEYFAQHGVTLDAEGLTSPDIKKLQYRSDDPVRKYELFRIAGSLPTGYSSFQNMSHGGIIEAKVGPDKYSTAASYVDTIVPNKKYYYCARAIDIHDNISNPTYIYEVEIVDNRGQMYLTSKAINLKGPKYNYKKSGKRYLAIEPMTEQVIYDNNVNTPAIIGINEAPTANLLGTTADAVWDKKFKIRVTSKKTGRKIDLNVTFKNTGVVIP